MESDLLHSGETALCDDSEGRAPLSLVSSSSFNTPLNLKTGKKKMEKKIITQPFYSCVNLGVKRGQKGGGGRGGGGFSNEGVESWRIQRGTFLPGCFGEWEILVAISTVKG